MNHNYVRFGPGPGPELSMNSRTNRPRLSSPHHASAAALADGGTEVLQNLDIVNIFVNCSGENCSYFLGQTFVGKWNWVSISVYG